MAQFILVDGSIQDFVSSHPDGFSLQELQDRVGGSIELVYLPDASKVMIVNEDGYSLHLAPNPVASLTAGHPIVGTAIIMNHAEWGDSGGEDDDDDCNDDEFDDCYDLDDEHNEPEWDNNIPDIFI